jgi:hypothetical protein
MGSRRLFFEVMVGVELGAWRVWLCLLPFPCCVAAAVCCFYSVLLFCFLVCCSVRMAGPCWCPSACVGWALVLCYVLKLLSLLCCFSAVLLGVALFLVLFPLLVLLVHRVVG